MSDVDKIIDAWADLTSAVLDAWLDCAKEWLSPIKPPSPKPDPKRTAAQTTVTIPATSDLQLRPSAFLDGEVHAIDASLVTVSPSSISAGQTATVTVTVTPPAGAPPGVYAGVIVDQGANVLTPRLPVTIGP